MSPHMVTVLYLLPLLFAVVMQGTIASLEERLSAQELLAGE